MPDTPLFSVIMPMFNAASTVAETMDSVLAQTCPDWELVVADNASTDAGPDIVAAYAARHPNIALLSSMVNSGGPACPRNRAIAVARGHYLAFLDADDLWEPEKLARVSPLLATGCEVVYHNVLFFGPNRRFVSRLPAVPAKARRFLIFRGNALCTSGTVVNRERLLAAKGFDERERYNTAEDYDLWLRLARDGARFTRLPEVLGRIRLSEGSMSARHAYHAQRTSNVTVDHLEDMRRRSEIGAAMFFHGRRRAQAVRDCQVGTHLTRAGRDRDALALYLVSAGHCPWYGYAWAGLALSLARLGRDAVKNCFKRSDHAIPPHS